MVFFVCLIIFFFLFVLFFSEIKSMYAFHVQKCQCSLVFNEIIYIIFTLQQRTVWDENVCVMCHQRDTSFIGALPCFWFQIITTTLITCAVFDLPGINLSEQNASLEIRPLRIHTKGTHYYLLSLKRLQIMRCRTLSRNLPRSPFWRLQWRHILEQLSLTSVWHCKSHYVNTIDWGHI